MSNIPEFSVTEISNLTKSILEENFNLIRVKGEISSVKNFKGHIYFSIKDDTNILNAVCWASNAPFLEVQPEDGIEVVAEGKISSYSKGSISSINYRLIKLKLKVKERYLSSLNKEKRNLRLRVYLMRVTKKKYRFYQQMLALSLHPQERL